MPTLRLVHPTECEVADPTLLYEWPESPIRWVRGSMVSTVDGAAAGPDGRSGSISTQADFALFVALRNDCDVIVVGAGTARGERYNPPKTARLAVVTGSGRLDPTLPFIAQARPTALPLVLTHRHADPASIRRLEGHAEVVVCGEEEVSMRSALDALAERGLRRVVVEGGPHLLGQLAADDLLDELDLQVTPLLAGGSYTHDRQPNRIMAGVPLAQPPAHLELRHIATDGATVFLRYTRADAAHDVRNGS